MDLNQLEKQAYRSRFRDGLREMNIGALMLAMGLIPLLEYFGIRSNIGFAVLFGLPIFAMITLEQRVIKPRQGYVRYNPARRKKLALAPVVIAMGVTVTFGLVILTLAGRFPGALSQIWGGWLLAAMFGSLALTVLSFAGYFLDNPRFYLIGLLLGVSMLLSEGLNDQWNAPWRELVIFGLSGGIVLAMGAASFRRFLKETDAVKGEFTMEERDHAN